ncbi:hypothetical protein JXR93_02725 [bacterium]|nr:hypothetical protein [bacterium]
MAEKEMLGSSSFGDKVKGLSEYLKQNVIDPAEKEKESILQEALKKQKEIIDQAKKEAEEIIKNAEKEAQRKASEVNSALQIAAKQAIGQLKLTLEKEVLNSSVTANVKDALKSDAVIKNALTDLINLYFKGEGTEDLELILSEDTKKALDSFIKKDVLEKAKGKITLSNQRIPAGFQVVFKDSKIMFDFSADAISELLKEYVRPELRAVLFGK